MQATGNGSLAAMGAQGGSRRDAAGTSGRTAAAPGQERELSLRVEQVMGVLRPLALNRQAADLTAEQQELLSSLGIAKEQAKQLAARATSGAAALAAVRVEVQRQQTQILLQQQQQAHAAAAQQQQQQQRAAAAAPFSQPAGRPAGQQPARPPSSKAASGGSGQQEVDGDPAPPRASLRDMLNEQRLRPAAYAPGEYRLTCPECGGGSTGEKSLGLTIAPEGRSAVWNCFRATCGWKGAADTAASSSGRGKQPYHNESGGGLARGAQLGAAVAPGSSLPDLTSRASMRALLRAGFVVSAMRKRKEEAPVRPAPKFDAVLSDEVSSHRPWPAAHGAWLAGLPAAHTPGWPAHLPQVRAFFHARGIDDATLERNRIAQETVDGTPVIAFPYYRFTGCGAEVPRMCGWSCGRLTCVPAARREGTLVNVKYRTLDKRFWQVKGAEKILYGLGELARRLAVAPPPGCAWHPHLPATPTACVGPCACCR